MNLHLTTKNIRSKKLPSDILNFHKCQKNQQYFIFLNTPSLSLKNSILYKRKLELRIIILGGQRKGGKLEIFGIHKLKFYIIKQMNNQTLPHLITSKHKTYFKQFYLFVYLFYKRF